MFETLIFWVAETQLTEKHYPVGKFWVRVESYRGGTDPLIWAEPNTMKGETLLNTYTPEKPQ